MMILPLDQEAALAEPPQMNVSRVTGGRRDICEKLVIFESGRDHYIFKLQINKKPSCAGCKAVGWVVESGQCCLGCAKFDNFMARETARSRAGVMPRVRPPTWAECREVFVVFTGVHSELRVEGR